MSQWDSLTFSLGKDLLFAEHIFDIFQDRLTADRLKITEITTIMSDIKVG